MILQEQVVQKVNGLSFDEMNDEIVVMFGGAG